MQNCNNKSTQVESDNLNNALNNEMRKGNLTKLIALADSIKLSTIKYDSIWMQADSFQQIAQRILIDFKYTEAEINKQLSERIGNYTTDEKEYWERTNLLENKLIDGEKRYFRNSVSNLLRKINAKNGLSKQSNLDKFKLNDTKQIIEQSKNSGSLVKPVTFDIVYTMTLNADALPDGEIVKCWMPLPKIIHNRHSDFQLISTSEKEFVIAPDTAYHHSIYMEKPAKSGKKTVFQIHYKYTSAAQYFDLNKIHPKDYDTTSYIYQNYVKEEKPHIIFSDRIKALADNIVGDEKLPVEIVKKLYKWIHNNIPWASALEYSTIECIPEYAIDNMKGDCGIKTLLFMSMARYKGIPVKWQSGWMLHPGMTNLHDWCEVFYQGIGWIPLDMSFGLQLSNNQNIKDFYVAGIDAYRMIVNDAISKDFYPKKKFLRSETCDFQRGEMEWKEGNLYFDKWDYQLKLKIEN